MAGLTTHVLDTAHGRPAGGMALRLYVLSEADVASRTLLRSLRTNDDGRTDEPLLSGEEMAVGHYRLEFDVAAYFRDCGIDLPAPPFLDIVAIEFAIADPPAHYHVPLLVTPYGYSTYRGS